VADRLDEERRRGNVEYVVRGLYEMHDDGAVSYFEHVEEPARTDLPHTVDVFRVVYAGGRQRTYPYAQARALIDGYRTGRDAGRQQQQRRTG
jgi:hypothetical protein